MHNNKELKEDPKGISRHTYIKESKTDLRTIKRRCQVKKRLKSTQCHKKTKKAKIKKESYNT